MNRHTTLLFLLLFTVLSLQAQEFTVKSFGVAPSDLDARSSETRRVDRNGTPCALVKVQLPLQGAQFDGVVGDVQFKAGVYWVYMPDGGYQLKISHPQFHVLDLNLRQLRPAAESFRGVEQLTTYNLIINVPQTGQVQLDNGMRYLALTVIPANSIVEIDGHDCPLESDGTAMIKLTQGPHSYRVKASGYAEEKSTLTIGNETLEKTIRLQSVLASVVVSCATPGAQIYVNGKPKGSSPWSGTLAGGNHDFEARLAGYRNGTVSVTLAERENRRVEIPALQPIAGNLDVAYRPMSTEVWIDGKKVGFSPNVFHGLAVGIHRVELRKEGYQSETKQVTIAEGQTAQLSGQLQQLQTSVSSTYSGTHQGHTWVDLGLSVKWGTTNVGAATEGDYGDYFAWGETSAKSSYNWSTYKYRKIYIDDNKYERSSITKYSEMDNKKQIDFYDDVARNIWGGKWRIPTSDEMKELCTNCTWTWISNNGNNGYRVTGPNGQSIFLPAAGYRYDQSISFVDSDGYYWSSSLNKTSYGSRDVDAHTLLFNSSNHRINYNLRYLGLTIRPVADLGLQAQKLTVESFGVAPGDLDARSSATRRTDRNGTPCALVKVQLPLQGAVFGGVVGNVQFRAGTYWVYLPDGAYLMSISHPQYHKLDLNLRSLRPASENFRGVEQLTTYNLIIKY